MKQAKPSRRDADWLRSERLQEEIQKLELSVERKKVYPEYCYVKTKESEMKIYYGPSYIKAHLCMLINVQKKIQKDGDYYWGASKGNFLLDVFLFCLNLYRERVLLLYTQNLRVQKRLNRRNSFALLRPAVNGRIQGQSMVSAGIRQLPHLVPHCPEFPGFKAAAHSGRDLSGLGRWGRGKRGRRGQQTNGKHQEVEDSRGPTEVWAYKRVV